MWMRCFYSFTQVVKYPHFPEIMVQPFIHFKCNGFMGLIYFFIYGKVSVCLTTSNGIGDRMNSSIDLPVKLV